MTLLPNPIPLNPPGSLAGPTAAPAPEQPGPLDPIDALRQIGVMFWQQGWSRGTSSNYSVRLSRDPFRLLITASGHDKLRLARENFVIVDERGQPVDPSYPKPSAETLLHVVAAGLPDVGAVLHTHSVWSTILSDFYGPQGHIEIAGYEMLKGLAGITTHASSVRFKIFENTQDIASLAEVVREQLADPAQPLKYGFVLKKHGIYTWGRDLEEARRHVEILEFLLEAVGRRLMLEGRRV